MLIITGDKQALNVHLLMATAKKVLLVVQIIFYLAAGLNHFRDPASYILIIPMYFPHPALLNIIAGVCEMGFAVLLMFEVTRKWGAWGIVLLMIAFIPVHVQMVTDAPFVLGGTWTVTPLIAWIRLIILQPLLILWAWWYTKTKKVSGLR